MSSYVRLDALKDLMCVHIRTHCTLVLISHLSSPLVKGESIIEDIPVQWYFLIGEQGALGFANIVTSKFTLWAPLSPSPSEERTLGVGG